MGHQLHRGAFHILVVHYQPLPISWKAKTRTFVSANDPEVFLRRFLHDAPGLRTLRAINREMNPVAGANDQDVAKSLAAALITGRVWTIKAKKPGRRHVSKTSPSAFAPINPSSALRSISPISPSWRTISGCAATCPSTRPAW